MFANNPVLFNDPTGEDINFYRWDYDEEDGWTKRKLSFSQLDKDVRESIEAFAKTELGYKFLSDFANKGDKIGDVEFTSSGKYSKHDLAYEQVSEYGSNYGSYLYDDKDKDKVTFTIRINNNRNAEDDNPASMAITLGHEAFLHMDQRRDKIIKGFEDVTNFTSLVQRTKYIMSAKENGDPDHKGYMLGEKKYSKMRKYVSQLKTILNPKEVDKHIKSHDRKYKEILNL